MQSFGWNADKNQKLMKERGISFEDVLFALQSGNLLDDGPHLNSSKYPHQRMMIVEIDDYAWLVPYLEGNQDIFLKTIIPSRKATESFIRKRQ